MPQDKHHTTPARDLFSAWRRRPYKRVLAGAFADGLIDSRQLHALVARVDAVLPWWRTDGLAWPIETYRGRPVRSALRAVCQNIRKVTG